MLRNEFCTPFLFHYGFMYICKLREIEHRPKEIDSLRLI